MTSKKELKKHLEIEDKFLSLFETNEINIEDLLEVANDFSMLRNQNFLRNEITINEIPIENTIIVKDKEFDSELLKNYEDCKKELISVYSFLEKDKTTTLNLDKIKDFLISFSKLVDEIYIEEIDINDKILVLTNKDEKKPLCFQNGKKIVMTKTNFDISNFTYDELIEILRFLDITITDNSYDYLRTEITKQIESISNISILKN